MSADELQAKLSYARKRLAAANDANANANELSSEAHSLGGGIPGFGGSGNQTAARTVRSSLERAHRAHQDADERIAKWEYKVASLERRTAERDRVPFTAADLKGATHVRFPHGWYRVVRINAKSVTVATPYSWTDRYPIEKVREFRTVAS